MKYFLSVLLLLLAVTTAHTQQCTQQQLNSEFTVDPTARAYNTCTGFPSGDDQCVLDKFNAPCINNTACKVDNILTLENIFQTIIDSAELEKLARSTVANDVARKSQLDWLTHIQSFNMAKAPWQQKWKNVFTPADSPNTNAAINAAQQKDAPRSQIVCGRPATLCDVSLGLRGQPC